MEFKLKNPVKLINVSTPQLQELLSHCAKNMGMITSIADKLTDEQYHELCHQCYLHNIDEVAGSSTVLHGNASFPVDEGEVHDWSIDVLHSERDVLKWTRDLLAAKLLSSTTGWDVYCSTMTAMENSDD